jgi:hypothetical protein
MCKQLGEITKIFTARSLGWAYGKVVSSVCGMSVSRMLLATPKQDLAVPVRGKLLRHVVCSDRVMSVLAVEKYSKNTQGSRLSMTECGGRVRKSDMRLFLALLVVDGAPARGLPHSHVASRDTCTPAVHTKLVPAAGTNFAQ